MARKRGGAFMSAAEAAEMLGLGRDTFRRWVKNGTIPFYRDEDTGVVYYPRPQLERLASELHTTGGAA